MSHLPPISYSLGPCPVLHICEVTRSISTPLVIYVQYTQSVSSGPCYEKLLRDSIIRVYANLVQKLREYLISLCHDD